MDQTPTNSESSNPQSEDLLHAVNKYHHELVGTRAYLLNIRNIIGKVRDFDSRQLTEMLNRVYRSSGSIQSFYQSLGQLTGHLQSSSLHRHGLLVALHSVDKQMSEYLLPAMTVFRDLSRTSSIQQIMSQRQNVLNQLDIAVDNLSNANEVVNNILNSIPPDEKSVSYDTNALNGDTQPAIDQPQSDQRSEQIDHPARDLLENNHSANHDADEFLESNDPLQIFQNQTELRNALHKALDQEDFRLLCFDLGVNHDDLEGKKLEMKMLSLIDYFNRRNRYPELVRKILQLYPYLADGPDIQ